MVRNNFLAEITFEFICNIFHLCITLTDSDPLF